jgi:arsenite methyltransferase
MKDGTALADRSAYYGVDAPGVVVALIGGGLFGAAVGVAARLFAPLSWLASAGAVFAVASAVLIVLGASMIAYAFRGKARLRDHMLGLHIWRGDEVVLDVGAGRGLMAVGAATRVPDGRVIAVDIWRKEDLSGNSPDALEANAHRVGVADRIEVRSDDARSLQLADASVDVVLSVLCVHNIEPLADRERALAEIVRVLRPGGCALIADYIGTPTYARWFDQAGLVVTGPRSVRRIALTSMAIVCAMKPTQ